MSANYADGGEPARRESDVVVGFTIKEMFLDIRSHLGKLEGMLEGKAGKSDLDAVDTRVTVLEKAYVAGEATIKEYEADIKPKVKAHETMLQRADAVRANLKSTWALVFGGAGALASLFAILRLVA